MDGYVAAFVPFVRTGNVIYVSGRVAKKEGKPWAGKLGENITIEEGKQAARDIAVELMATLQAAVGDLNKIARIVKLMVLVNSTPHFTEPHVVANGASELLREVLASAERMRGVRLAWRRFRLVAALRSKWLLRP